MTSDSPSPTKSVWESFIGAVGGARSLRLTPVPTVLSEEESKFLGLAKAGANDRETTLRDGLRLMANNEAQDASKMTTVAIELLHFPKGVSPTLKNRDPPPSTSPAEHGDVLRDLLETRGPRTLHPYNISALVDGYFTLISLCLYRPDNADTSQNLTTPYLDLSPLYGCTKKMADKIRTNDGRGTLRPDCFCEERVQLLPPIVSVLLILWNRNHNFIAHNLFIRFAIKKAWKADFGANGPAKAKQDDALFAVAQWINCMQFRNTVAEDILKGLFGLSSFDSSLRLDILGDVPSRPKGNGMKAYKESSFLHTLSPMISENDSSIVEERMREITGLDDIKGLSPSAFRELYSKFFVDSDQDPTTCNYPRLQRDARTGQFKDEDLARILTSAREELACAPTAKNSPPCSAIFHLEVLQDERNWRTCTFNEFRKSYGLKTLPSFTAWNADPAIADAAENLYGHIDKLGLYAGLQCEASSPSGFGFGFTKTYALIVDLVTRIRSDTASKGPSLLSDKDEVFSAWMKSEIDLDRSRQGNGAALPKVLQRNLPEFTPYDSAHTYFLFSVPSSFDTDTIKNSGLTLEKPPERYPVHTISDLTAVQHVFQNTHKYHTLYADGLSKVTGDYGYLLGFDASVKDLEEPDKDRRMITRHDKDRLMTMYALIPDVGSLQRYGSLFGNLTALAIKKHRKPKGGNGKIRIDVIGDVINEVCTRWVCETFCDYRLKGDEASPEETTKFKLAFTRSKTAKEMHKEFANIYTFIVKTFPHEDGHEAERRAIESSRFLRNHIEQRIPKPEWLLPQGPQSLFLKQISQLINAKTWKTWRWFMMLNVQIFLDFGWKLFIVYFGGIHLNAHTAQTFLDRVVQANRLIPLPKSDLERRINDKLATKITKGTKPTQEQLDDIMRDIEVSRIVANILGLAAMIAVNFPQACSLVVDFYLQEKYAEERKEIVRLSQIVTNTEQERLDVNRVIMGYIYEALRISQPLALWRRAVEHDKITVPNSKITVQPGDVIFADFHKVHNTGEDWHKVKVKISHDLSVVTDGSPTGLLRRQTLERPPDSLLGVGPHKCPAFTKDHTKSFIDATMPEVIKAIFSLQGLSWIDNNPHGALNSVQVHPNATPMDPRALISQTGELAYYPQMLVLEYDDPSLSYKEEEEKNLEIWESGIVSNPARKVTKAIEKALAIGASAWIVYKIILLLLAFWARILLLLGYSPRLRRAIKVVQQADVKQVYVECPEPLTPWDEWVPKVMDAGPEGTPQDIVYNSTLPIPHRLQLFDADKKDTRLALYVDDVLRDLSPDFEVDKNEDCGIEPYNCYIKKFSGADVVIPAGSHSVRIEWAGNEFIHGTTIPDLGEDVSRRILWARYYCGPRP